MTDDQGFAGDQPGATHSQSDIERRAMLRRLGALAALTPPAVVTMLVTARTAAAVSP